MGRLDVERGCIVRADVLQNEDIICIAPNPWDDIWRRRHQLMSRFARGNRVLYVEPASFILFALFRRRGLARLFKGSFYRRREGDSLFILSQYLILPFEGASLRRGVGLIKSINDWFCVRILQRTIRRLDFNSPILWVYYTPRSESFIGKCGERLVVCDVFDRYSAYPHIRADAWLKEFTDQQDASLIRQADVVFAVSQPLHDYCKQLNSKAFLVPNGTDILLTGMVSTVPKDVGNIRHPVLGYVGAIFDKLDFELLGYVAREHPEWSILMIGPVGAASLEAEKRVSSLKEMANVMFLGAKHREELPGYYEAIDVALMPYELTEHTEHIFPLKMFEYMAFRKPIVSTDIPAVREFSEVIAIARNPAQFVDGISRLLDGDNRQRLQRGFEIAQESSWDNKVEEISQIIHNRSQRDAR